MSATSTIPSGLLAAALLCGTGFAQSGPTVPVRQLASVPGSNSLYSTPLLQRSASTPFAQQAGGGCEILFDQAPDGLNAYFSDAETDFSGGTQTLAESLQLAEDKEICDIRIWGLFFPGSTVPPGGFELVVHEDDLGVPGAVIYSESNVASTITPTGNVLFAADEVQVDLVPAVPFLLNGGTTYWIEIYYTSGFGTDDFVWETGTLDPLAGGIGFSVAFEAPGTIWVDAGVPEELAMVVRGVDPFDPCANDDFLEDNDDCGQEIALGDGFYPALFASKTDWDYFSLTVAAGDTVDISVSHKQVFGDIDAFLYAAEMCADFASGDVGCADTLDCAFTFDDVETLSYTNTSGECETYILKINVWPPTTTGECNNYDLMITGTVGAPIGTSYCAQNTNSTGQVALITALGSDVAAASELSLVANRMPANQIGFFIVSLNPGAVDLPGVGLSDGLLCLGTGKGRYNGQNGNPGAVLNSGDAGTFCLGGIDTGMIPLSSGMSYAAMTGTSNYFTAWFRDPSGTVGNNFTDAVQIDWL